LKNKEEHLVRTRILTLALTLAATILKADEGADLPEEISNKSSESIYHTRDHRFFFGLDGFWNHQEWKHYMSWSPIVQIDNYDEFGGGIRAGYDHISPNDYYFGYEGMVVLGRGHLTAQNDPNSPVFHRQTVLTAFEEVRVGYNFATDKKRWIIAPYGGIGLYEIQPRWQRMDFSSFSESIFYGALGVRSDCAVTSILDVGLYLKALHSFYRNLHVKFRTTELESMNGQLVEVSKKIAVNKKLKNIWGYEIDLPITIRLGEKSPWDIQVQPYFIQLNTGNHSTITGVRLSAGYNF